MPSGPINGPYWASSFGLRPQELCLSLNRREGSEDRMPAKGTTKAAPALTARKKVGLTREEAAALARKAKSCGMSESKFMRHLVLVSLEQKEKPPARKRRAVANELTVEIHTLALQAKRIGTNVNQIAKQANTGLVPVSRAEIQYVLNQLQMLVSAGVAHIEKAGA